MFYLGCVENRLDPLKMGRCQVRVVGLHTEDKVQLPTDDLPWAYPMGTINSASISGIGWAPTGVVQGTWVICIFLDGDSAQQPIMIGTIGGIPHTQTATYMSESGGRIITTNDDGDLTTGAGDIVTDVIDEIINITNPPVEQAKGLKYNISAVTVQSADGNTVTYNINQTDNSNKSIATATFDTTTELYSVTLTTPENYTDTQYLPFTQPVLKTFKSTDEMLLYFDTNF